MRRKFGILFLIAITVLAGTQEAARQFEGLRATVNEFTRASLWSGLIVYAQPVTDGKVPAPQIYYLMPQPQTPSAPQEALLVENNNAANPAKPETKNNHVAEELAAATTTDALPQLMLEVEDAAKSELVLDKLPAHVPSRMIATHLGHAALKLDKARVYEEVAHNEVRARKFKGDAVVIAKELVKEFDAAKLEAELARLAAAHEQLETAKLKSFGDAEISAARRLELRVLRRSARHEHRERPERPERIKVIAPYADRRAIVLPEISSIGCEKTTSEAEAAAAVEATVAVAGVATSVMLASEPTMAAAPVVTVEPSLPAVVAAPLTTSSSWALGCDTEPEFK